VQGSAPRQNDFRHAGPVFSFIAIIPATLGIHGMLLALILDWWNGVAAWWMRSYAPAMMILDWVKEQVAQLS